MIDKYRPYGAPSLPFLITTKLASPRDLITNRNNQSDWTLHFMGMIDLIDGEQSPSRTYVQFSIAS